MENIDRETILEEIGGVSLIQADLKCEPVVASQGDKIWITIETNDQVKWSDNLSLLLVSESGEALCDIEFDLQVQKTEFLIPEIIAEGEYTIELRQDCWILDSVSFEVADKEDSKQAHALSQGLELRIQALDEVKVGNYTTALVLSEKVEKFYTQASYTSLAARSWKEVAASLLKAKQFKNALKALERAYELYKNSNDPKGQAESLFLIGQILTLEQPSDDILDVFQRARNIADSCEADIISLRSSEALLRLSRSLKEDLHQGYREALIHKCFAVKSPVSRLEAMTLFRKLEFPKPSYRNWLLENDQPYGEIHLVCTVLSNKFTSVDWASIYGRDVGFPWENALAKFSSTLLIQVIRSISRIAYRICEYDLIFKITTSRDNTIESFLVEVEKAKNELVDIQIIKNIYQNNDELRYYSDLAKAAGASLEIGNNISGEFSIAKMIHPLRVNED